MRPTCLEQEWAVWGVILLLFVMFPEKILIVLVLMGIAATLIVSRYTFRGQAVYTKHWTDVSIIIGRRLLLHCGMDDVEYFFVQEPEPITAVPGTKVIARYSSPQGLISVSKEF